MWDAHVLPIIQITVDNSGDSTMHALQFFFRYNTKNKTITG